MMMMLSKYDEKNELWEKFHSMSNGILIDSALLKIALWVIHFLCIHSFL